MESNRIDETVLDWVRAKARSMKGNPAFRHLEEDELVSELVVELEERRKKYDPTKSPWKPFVHLVINGKAAKLLRHYTNMAETEWRRCQSLDVIVGYGEDGTAMTMADQIEDRSHGADADFRAMDIDLADFARHLSGELREAFELLRRHTQSEAAKRMKMALATFRDRCLYQLRELLSAYWGRPTAKGCPGK